MKNVPFVFIKKDAVLSLAFIFFITYVFLVLFVVNAKEPWAFDYLGGFRLLSHDDAYRYYFSWSEWLNFESYKWTYILPVPMVLDGLVASLTSGNQTIMRIVHIAGSTTALWALGRSLLMLGVHGKLVVASLILLGTMPLYALVSISFLGESWLLPTLALVAYFYLRNALLPMTLLASLLPLIRPEGIFALFSISLWLLFKRRYWLFVLSGLPGFLYLLYLIWLFEPLSEMEVWRHQFVDYYQNFPKRESLQRSLGYLDTFNLFFIVGAVLAFSSSLWRRHWALWLGPFLWFLYISQAIAINMTNYEPRYVVVSLPVLLLAWGVFCQYAYKKAIALESSQCQWGSMLVVGMTLLITAEHALQLDWLRKDTAGRRFPLDSKLAVMPDTNWHAPASYLKDRRDAVEQIIQRLREDPAIDTVLVAKDDVFHALIPSQVPYGVRVMIAPFDSRIALTVLDGVFYAFGPKGRLYGYFELYMGGAEHQKKLLYVGNLHCRICKPGYENRNYQFHEFNYVEHNKMPGYEAVLQ